MKLLLHACCAPCSIECVASLRQEGIEPVLYWFNPNIHLAKEYKQRLNQLREYAKDEKLELIVDGEYGLLEFLKETEGNNKGQGRCSICYAMRLSRTADFARQNGFGTFSTTLLISPYQNRDLLVLQGQKSAEQNQVEFLDRDFRPLFRSGQQKAREANMYMQSYCGCLYSEMERYIKPKKNV